MKDNTWHWSDSGKTCTNCGKWMTNGEVEEFGQCVECEAREWRAIKERMGKELIQGQNGQREATT